MPHVFTIQGAGLGEHCKRVKNRKTGCSIVTCKGARGRWKFKKGTSECPGGRRR